MKNKQIYKRKIFGYECDVYGHLNNANYLHIYEEARSEALDNLGIPVKKLADSGYHIYLTKIELKFFKSISIESGITVVSCTEKADRLSSVWLQEIYNEDKELCNQAIVSAVFVKKGKPCRLSREIYDLYFKKLSE